ncbi:hypothetical protein PROFUN_12935 [Planoprotostelium fungivorum]|uniref:Uncharacterized protein n=1 Tax=Planoprotostelium fungivorum TaxID=1890364 RepID=A0A2P6N5W0_9EUKA|nr:hypothetical protein PROFUN_12935 [Planoprotostelium fungivorum]
MYHKWRCNVSGSQRIDIKIRVSVLSCNFRIRLDKKSLVLSRSRLANFTISTSLVSSLSTLGACEGFVPETVPKQSPRQVRLCRSLAIALCRGQGGDKRMFILDASSSLGPEAELQSGEPALQVPFIAGLLLRSQPTPTLNLASKQ